MSILKPKEVFKTATITLIGAGGRHVLDGGQVADALTDEKLRQGDRVRLIQDDKGKLFIIAGDK